VFTLYTLSGYALKGQNMEMDTIATVVIGGTLLTGGVGTVLGVLAFPFCFMRGVFEAQKAKRKKQFVTVAPAADAKLNAS
jgi:hypothetical protein